MTPEAGPALRAGWDFHLRAWRKDQLSIFGGFTQHIFQVAVYGVKVNFKQPFCSPRCEPGEGQAVGQPSSGHLDFTVLVFWAAGHLKVTGLRAEEAGLPQHLTVSLQVLTTG